MATDFITELYDLARTTLGSDEELAQFRARMQDQQNRSSLYRELGDAAKSKYGDEDTFLSHFDDSAEKSADNVQAKAQSVSESVGEQKENDAKQEGGGTKGMYFGFRKTDLSGVANTPKVGVGIQGLNQGRNNWQAAEGAALADSYERVAPQIQQSGEQRSETLEQLGKGGTAYDGKIGLSSEQQQKIQNKMETGAYITDAERAAMNETNRQSVESTPSPVMPKLVTPQEARSVQQTLDDLWSNRFNSKTDEMLRQRDAEIEQSMRDANNKYGHNAAGMVEMMRKVKNVADYNNVIADYLESVKIYLAAHGIDQNNAVYEQSMNYMAAKLYDKLVDMHMPKNDVGYFIRNALASNSVGQGVMAAFTPQSSRQIEAQAMAEYGQDKPILSGVSSGVGILTDPLLKGVGKGVGYMAKPVMTGIEKGFYHMFGNRMLTSGFLNWSERALAKSFVGGVNFGTYEALAAPLSKMSVGEDYQLSDSWKAFKHGFVLGSISGLVGSATKGMTSNWTSTAGKVTSNFLGLAGETAVFSTSQLIELNQELKKQGKELTIGDFVGAVAQNGAMVLTTNIAHAAAEGKDFRGFAKEFFNIGTNAQERELAKLSLYDAKDISEMNRVGVDANRFMELESKQRLYPDKMTANETMELADMYSHLQGSDAMYRTKAKAVFRIEKKLAPTPHITDYFVADMGNGRATVYVYSTDASGKQIIVDEMQFANRRSADRYVAEEQLEDRKIIGQFQQRMNEYNQFLGAEIISATAKEMGVSVDDILNAYNKKESGEALTAEEATLLARFDATSKYLQQQGKVPPSIQQICPQADRLFGKPFSRFTAEEKAMYADYYQKLENALAKAMGEQTESDWNQGSNAQAVTKRIEAAAENTQDDGMVHEVTLNDGSKGVVLSGDVSDKTKPVVVKTADGNVKQVTNDKNAPEYIETEEVVSVEEHAQHNQRREEISNLKVGDSVTLMNGERVAVGEDGKPHTANVTDIDESGNVTVQLDNGAVAVLDADEAMESLSTRVVREKGALTDEEGNLFEVVPQQDGTMSIVKVDEEGNRVFVDNCTPEEINEKLASGEYRDPAAAPYIPSDESEGTGAGTVAGTANGSANGSADGSADGAWASVPMDENGMKLYTEAPVDVTSADLVADLGEDLALSSVQAQIRSLTEEVASLADGAPTKGGMNEIVQKAKERKQKQDELKYWVDVEKSLTPDVTDEGKDVPLSGDIAERTQQITDIAADMGVGVSVISNTDAAGVKKTLMELHGYNEDAANRITHLVVEEKRVTAFTTPDGSVVVVAEKNANSKRTKSRIAHEETHADFKGVESEAREILSDIGNKGAKALLKSMVSDNVYRRYEKEYGNNGIAYIDEALAQAHEIAELEGKPVEDVLREHGIDNEEVINLANKLGNAKQQRRRDARIRGNGQQRQPLVSRTDTNGNRRSAETGRGESGEVSNRNSGHSDGLPRHEEASTEIADALESVSTSNDPVGAVEKLAGEDVDINDVESVEQHEAALAEAKHLIGADKVEAAVSHDSSTRFSVSSEIEGAGFTAKTKDGAALTDKEGNMVIKLGDEEFSAKRKVTTDDLKNAKNSILNYMINDAIHFGTVDEAKVKEVYDKYADLLNFYLELGSAENGGVGNVTDKWQWLGETVFRSVAKNGDKQYLKSIDITRICKKNEAVINAISEMQVRLGYGVTPGQILDIYDQTIVEGYQAPCPVCYVFTRYIRNGNLASAAINGMRKYGSHLPGEKDAWTVKQWEDELERVTAVEEENADTIDRAKDVVVEVFDTIDNLGRQYLAEKDPAKKAQLKSQIEVLDSEYRKASDVIAQTSLSNWIKSFAIQKKKGKNVLRTDSPLPKDMADFERHALDLRLTASTYAKYPAIQRLRKSKGSSGGKEITQASNNELGMIVQALGQGNPETSTNWYEKAAKATTDNARDGYLKKARNSFKAAMIYARQQSLRGGQRQWSWSDNIERLANDVAANIMQLDLLGGAMQTYSKQLEGINLVANMGGYVNGSLMGKGLGYREVKAKDIVEVNGVKVVKGGEFSFDVKGKDGKTKTVTLQSTVYEQDGKYYTLEFDDVVGVDAFGKNGKKGLFYLNATLDKAGNIIVGMNDIHCKAAMNDDRIYFIIPWHSSGANQHVLAQMYNYLGVRFNTADALDYTPMQEDKSYCKAGEGGILPNIPERLKAIWEFAERNGKEFKSGMVVDSSAPDGTVTPSQIKYREIRDAILRGIPRNVVKKNGKSGVEYDRVETNKEFMNIIKNDEFLSQVYNKVKAYTNGGLMTNEDTNHIYPYEYWDEKSTFGTAQVNGFRYLEYCRRLGHKPKFCGRVDSSDELSAKQGYFIEERGYWKTLIDRKMYDCNGNFQDLTPVDFGGFRNELIDPEYTKENFEVTKVADDAGTTRIVNNTIAKEQKRSGSVAGVNYEQNMEDAVRKFNDPTEAPTEGLNFDKGGTMFSIEIDDKQVNNGIYVKQTKDKYLDKILDKEKTIETRTPEAWRRMQRDGIKIGDTIALMADGKIQGYAKLADVKVYGSKEEFDKDYDKHLVSGGEYGYDEKKGKVGLVLEDATRIEPIAIPYMGRRGSRGSEDFRPYDGGKPSDESEGTVADGPDGNDGTRYSEGENNSSISDRIIANHDVTDDEFKNSVKIINDIADNYIGKTLEYDKVPIFIDCLKNVAEIVPEEIDFTEESYNAMFGKGVETPIGKVKMSDGQKKKMSDKHRTRQLGFAKRTLESPDFIIEKPSSAKEGQITERPFSYLFVKTFVNEDGTEVTHYYSVTVQKDGLEISMSNYDPEEKQVKRELREGKLTYINKVTLPTDANNSVQGDQPFGSVGSFSAGKGTTSSATDQTNDTKNSLKRDITDTRSDEQVKADVDKYFPEDKIELGGKYEKIGNADYKGSAYMKWNQLFNPLMNYVGRTDAEANPTPWNNKNGNVTDIRVTSKSNADRIPTIWDYYQDTEATFKPVVDDVEGESKIQRMRRIRDTWEEMKASDKYLYHKSPYRGSRSEYLIDRSTGDIYRFSNHWGDVASCKWDLEGDKGNNDMEIGVCNIADFKDFTRDYHTFLSDSYSDGYLKALDKTIRNYEWVLNGGKELGEGVRERMQDALDSYYLLRENIVNERENGEVNKRDSQVYEQKVRFSFDTDEETPVFVSNAAKAVEGVKQEKANASQWLAMLEKSGGIKAGEDKWLGLRNWLGEQGALAIAGKRDKNITKAEILDYIAKNNIQIEEVKYADIHDVNLNNVYDALDAMQPEWKNAVARAKDEVGDTWRLYVRASEIMSEKYGDKFESAIDIRDNGTLRIKPGMTKQFAEMVGVEMPATTDVTRLKYTTKGLTNKREIALTVPTIEPYNEGDNIHFGDAGGGRAVAWVRFGDATSANADGTVAKVLVIDEVQSKRHQDGRERGYAGNSLTPEEYNAERSRLRQIEISAGTEAEREEAHRQRMDLESRYISRDQFSVPDAPFDKNWHELAMKRMLRYAAENGYDKVAWTTGAQQAKRYDLSNTVDRIVVERNGDGTYMFNAMDDSNSTLNFGERYTQKEIEGLVGKEIAAKLIEGADREGHYESTEGDLSLGGEGMKGFYDKMLPSFMNKYGKKWGAKVGEVELDLPNESDRKMWSVDVTDAMKESLKKEPQVMFAVDTEEESEAAAPEPKGAEALILDTYAQMEKDRNRWAEGVRKFHDVVTRKVKDAVKELNTFRDDVEASGDEALNALADYRKAVVATATNLVKRLNNDMGAFTPHELNMVLSDLKKLENETTVHGLKMGIANVLDTFVDKRLKLAADCIDRASRGDRTTAKAGNMVIKNLDEYANEGLDFLRRLLWTSGHEGWMNVDDNTVARFETELEELRQKETELENATAATPEEELARQNALKTVRRRISYRENYISRPQRFEEMKSALDTEIEKMAEEWQDMTANPDADPEAKHRLDVIMPIVYDYQQYKSHLDNVMRDIATLEQGIAETRSKWTHANGEERNALRQQIFSLTASLLDSKNELLELKSGFAERIMNYKTANSIGDDFRNVVMERQDAALHAMRSDFKGINQKSASSNREHPNGRENLGLMATFANLCEFFGRHATDGRGAMYRHFVPMWIKSRNTQITGMEYATERLADIATAALGKKYKPGSRRWKEAFASLAGRADILVNDWAKKKGIRPLDIKVYDIDNVENLVDKWSVGNILYVLACEEQEDGKMKLRNMGIDEDAIRKINAWIEQDDELVRMRTALSKIQHEVLPELVKKYNKTHKEVFGVGMKFNDNYFPLKIDKSEVQTETELGSGQKTLPGTITGALITRTKNNKRLDITGNNAFDLAMSHIQEMEDWNAFCRFREDCSTILNSKLFKNKLNSINGLFGSGKALYDTFENACNIACGLYRTEQEKAFNILDAVASTVVGMHIKFNPFPALKQTTSIGFAFQNGVNAFLKAFTGQKRGLAKPGDNIRWASENLPIFRERMRSGDMGYEILKDIESDNKWVNMMLEPKRFFDRYGMTLNRFVDTWVCSVVARAEYEASKKNYKALGYPEEEIERRSLINAAIRFNESQQSSENAFMARVQKNRSFFTSPILAYQNSPFAYARLLWSSARNMQRYLKDTPEDRQRRYEQAERLYLDEGGTDKAKFAKEWKNTERRNMMKNVFQFAAALSGYLFYKLASSYIYSMFGDDDKLRRQNLGKSAIMTGVNALTSGIPYVGLGVDSFVDALLRNGVTRDAADDIFPTTFFSEWFEGAFKYGAVGIANKDVVDITRGMARLVGTPLTGIDFDLLSNITTGFVEACRMDAETSKKVLFGTLALLNSPRGEREDLMIDELIKPVTEYLKEEEKAKLSSSDIADMTDDFSDLNPQAQRAVRAWVKNYVDFCVSRNMGVFSVKKEDLAMDDDDWYDEDEAPEVSNVTAKRLKEEDKAMKRLVKKINERLEMNGEKERLEKLIEDNEL